MRARTSRVSRHRKSSTSASVTHSNLLEHAKHRASVDWSLVTPSSSMEDDDSSRSTVALRRRSFSSPRSWLQPSPSQARKLLSPFTKAKKPHIWSGDAGDSPSAILASSPSPTSCSPKSVTPVMQLKENFFMANLASDILSAKISEPHLAALEEDESLVSSIFPDLEVDVNRESCPECNRELTVEDLQVTRCI